MAERFQPARNLPGAIKKLASAVIGFHLLALGVAVLAAPSGPWPMLNGGASDSLPPQFAYELSKITTQYYLEPLSLASDYHFVSNQTLLPTITLEVRLYYGQDKREKPKTALFPEPGANVWVRNQQSQLAQALGRDQPYPINPDPGVAIQPPGGKPKRITFWLPLPDGPRSVALRQTEEQFLRLASPAPMAPRDQTLILARAYARYLKRLYPEATRIELVRCSRNPAMPVLLLPNPRIPGGLVLDDPRPELRYWETLYSNLRDGEPENWQPPKSGDWSEGG